MKGNITQRTSDLLPVCADTPDSGILGHSI